MHSVFAQRMRELLKADEGSEIGRLSTQLRNIGHLLTGNAMGAVVAFAAMAIAAQTIGPAKFGILALCIALTQTVERFVDFQTWQPFIRFGAGLMENGKRDDYRTLIKVTAILDVSAAIVGWAIVTTVMVIGYNLFGWSDEYFQSGLIYACVLLASIKGAPVGILRLAGRFQAIAYRQVFAMSLRLALAILAAAMDGGLLAFTLIWAGTTMLNTLLLVFAAVRSLHREGLLDFVRAPIKNVSQRFEGFWKFTIGANLTLMVRSAPQQADTLIVGALIDPVAAGFYHVAKRFAKVAEQAGQQIQAVVYPDIAKLWAKGDVERLRKVFLRTEISMAVICASGFGLAFVIAPIAVPMLVGEEFAAASQLVILQIGAVALMLIGSTARSGALAAGRTNTLLAMSSSVSLLFFVIAVFLIHRLGAAGANIAHIIQQALYLIGVTVLFRHAMRSLAAEKADVVSSTSDEEKP